MVTASQARDRGPVARRIAATYLAPRWRAMVIAFGCALAFAVVTALLLQILRPAVNDVTAISVAARRGGDSQGPLSRLIGLAGLVVLLALVKGGMQIAQATLVNSIGNGVVGDIQRRLFKGLVRADLGRLRDTHSGGHISSVLYDASLIREAATSGLVNLVQQSLTLAAVIVVMFVMDWRLSLLVVVAGPIVVFVLRRFSRRAGKAARGAMEATGALSSAIMESLDGVRVVKIENREAYEEHRVAAVIAERQRHIIAGDNARAFAAPTSETLMTGVVAAVLIYEGWQAAAGHTDIGGFIAFFAALLQAGNAVRQVANYPGLYSQGLAAARRLFAALDIQAEIRDPPGAPALHVERGGVRFDDVTFAYGNGEPVLRGVSLTLERGETVALVGPSGAGKSTVLNLIPRFYDVGGGAVTIDGQDVRAVGLASLRSRIGLVTQEPFLFDDTIGANIAYSLPDAGPAAIEAAARAAAAHDFIVSLPRGYDTRVGEAGARLSGGQRQRIAIARAFLKDAPILLLDEATSALDAESEAQVQAALARLMAGRTTLLIAHRLSTVRSADRIYVLDRGVVVETGSHEALVAAGGLYRRLAQGQNLAHPEAAAS